MPLGFSFTRLRWDSKAWLNRQTPHGVTVRAHGKGVVVVWGVCGGGNGGIAEGEAYREMSHTMPMAMPCQHKQMSHHLRKKNEN